MIDCNLAKITRKNSFEGQICLRNNFSQATFTIQIVDWDAQERSYGLFVFLDECMRELAFFADIDYVDQHARQLSLSISMVRPEFNSVVVSVTAALHSVIYDHFFKDIDPVVPKKSDKLLRWYKTFEAEHIKDVSDVGFERVPELLNKLSSLPLL